jgi:hypothetical protein
VYLVGLHIYCKMIHGPYNIKAVRCLMQVCGHTNVPATTFKCSTKPHLLIITYPYLYFYRLIHIYLPTICFPNLNLNIFSYFISLLLPPFAFFYSLSSLSLTRTHPPPPTHTLFIPFSSFLQLSPFLFHLSCNLTLLI